MIGLPAHLLPPADLPSGTLPGSLAARRLYAGDDLAALSLAIVAGARAENITIGHDPGTRRYYRLRNVSAAGVEERNTHVEALVRVDEAGTLQPVLPPCPKDVVCWRGSDGRLLCGFSWQTEPGQRQPDGFEVFGSSAADTVGLHAPLVTLSADDETGETVVRLPEEATPAWLAVRALAGTQADSWSTVVAVPTAIVPCPPELLPEL